MEKTQSKGEGEALKRLLCATLDGVAAKVVEVESSFTRALPSFSIVGLVSSSIQEAKERVRSALSSCGFTFPPQKITINLAPSDLKKSGSHFDLAIALAIALYKEPVEFEDIFIFGELGLDGSLKSNSQIFPIVLSLATKPIKVFAPLEARELASIPNVTLYGARTLSQAIEAFKNGSLQEVRAKAFSYPSLKGGYYTKEYPLDFAQVKGQRFAKRAALIAAAGMHNILFEGSPGCGKSMIAKRMRYILPPMRLDEILQKAKMQALSGQEIDFTPHRPYRAPHHSASKPSIFGGGSAAAKPGEVALAHRGMLFFDELPHFSRTVLEALREPLQDGRVLISRVQSKIEYPAKFLFVGAQNPCPCGNLLSSSKECRCSEVEIRRYKSRLSEPLLDRIELYVKMDEVSAKDKSDIDSATMHRQILQAYVFMRDRGQKEFNGWLDEQEVERFCVMDEEAQNILERSIARFGLSHRSVINLKKVARTIADLEQSQKICKAHILEAIGYKRR